MRVALHSTIRAGAVDQYREHHARVPDELRALFDRVGVDRQEFALLSANVREGGMVDGQLRRVVMFPDDGHPDLSYQVMNVTGDERDEIIVWDQDAVWIYTQDRPFNGTRIYAPVRNPMYNDSNYRATVSTPAWKN